MIQVDSDSRKVVDYLLVHATHRESLTNKVRVKICEGYQPIGGVHVTNGGDKYQAVVKYGS